jgi:5'-nucleotidase (lipoprotein e(P4) family)
MKTVHCGFATKVVMRCLVIVFATGAWAPGQSPTPSAVEDLPNRSLDANLYMQTSGEYRASCYQAYYLATLRLKQAVKEKTGKLAVVMDLDETVFDNAGFQAMQLRGGNGYDPALWEKWERDYADKIELVPGAREFIREAKTLGVSVIYISNRDEKFREQTKRALERLEIFVEPDSLLRLSTGPSDKTARRQEVERDYTVLLYVGDNLRDFDESLAFDRLGFGEIKKLPDNKLDAVIKARKDAVDKRRAIWGVKWIILPNPAYGEWTKPVGRGRADYDRLVPTGPPR